MASDANSTRASAGTTPAEVTDSNQSVPAPSTYDSVAPWDTSFDHDAKSGLKGTLGEKLKDTNVPKGTLGDKFGEDTDLVKHQQEHVSPTSHQAKISEPVTAAKSFAMASDANSASANSGPTPTPTQVIDFNQNAPAPTAHEPVSPERHGVNSGNLKSIPVGEQSREDDSLDTQKQQPREDVSPGNYQTKLTDTGANGDRDAGVSPILHSFDKMAINDDSQHQTEGHDQSSASPILGRQSIPESFDATTDRKHPQQGDIAVADKASSAKDVTAPKADQDQNDDDFTSDNVDDAYVSALEPPKEQQSTNTEMLSSPLPVQGSEMAEGDVSNVHSGSGDAAVSGLESPKPQSTYMGMLASKLGYGGTDNAPVQGSEMSEGDGANVQSESEMNKSDSTTAQSGSGVLSKIPDIGVGTQQKTDEDADIGATHESTAGVATVGKTDKEEGMGEAEEKKGVHEAVNDASHKSNTDENMDREKMDVPMGKVTESEEVANRLGSSEEERTGTVYSGTGSESPSTGVVDRFKGAFTNWFGKGGETNPAVDFNDQNKQPQGPTAEQDNISREAERRPQANEQ